MTNDFKNFTLKYITKNIQPEANKTNAFIDNLEITNNLRQTLIQEIGYAPSTYLILTTDTTSNYLMYGDYDIGSSVYYGYIAILDENGKIQKVFTTYDSGTKLSPSMELNYDENGNIYGIDKTGSLYRIILLNNIALNSSSGYHCRLRASYYINYDFAKQYSAYEGTCTIKKVPEEAIYYLFGQNGTSKKELLIKFVNNVGIPNDWYYYEGTNSPTTINGKDFLIEKNGDNQTVDIYYESDKTALIHIYFNGQTLSNVASYSMPSGYPIMDLRIASKNNVYISSRHINNSTYDMYLYLIKNTSTIETVNTFNFSASIPAYYLEYKNGFVFGKVSGYTTTSPAEFRYVCVVYDGSSVTKSTTYSSSISDYITTGCSVQNTFNLYKFLVHGETKCFHPSIVIYNGYTGAAKEGYGSTSAARGELFSNNYIMFARQLYNKQVINNRTISTLEVPNNYLNGIMIDKKNLVSSLNNILMSDTNQIEKNIYEQLFINFGITLNVIDSDTSTQYPNTATYINTNINEGTQQNYENTNISKVKINYSNSYVTKSITWTNNTTYYQTSFTIDAINESPTSVDFVSNDETTVYITKQLNLVQGHTYTLSQKLKIE